MSAKRGFFVTGTDTGVGKTVVAALLTLQVPGARYWKPIQSGLPPLADSTDREDVARWTGLPPERLLPEAYRLKLPQSPHVAAAAEGVVVERERLRVPAVPGTEAPLIVEGAGGLMVPINDHELMIDLIGWLGLPVVLVARTALGTINHTLLSLEALHRRNLPVAGLVLNGEPVATTTATLRTWGLLGGHIPILAEIPPLPRLDRATLESVEVRW